MSDQQQASAQPALKFEDRYADFIGTSPHIQTNESVDAFIKLLDGLGRRFRRAGAICSGGEVPLIVLAPRCEEVLAIDHVYRPLAVAYTKALLLADGKEKALVANTKEEFEAAWNAVKPRLPEKLVGHWPAGMYYEYKYGPDGRGYYDPPPTANMMTVSHHTFAHEWAKYAEEWIQAARTSVAKVQFLHGDFTDLPGTFDLLYLSNMLEHTSRHDNPASKYNWDKKTAPPIEKVDALLEPGGYVLMTGGRYEKANWKLIKAMDAPGTSWTHRLLQKPAITEQPAAVAA